jgi:hypothetical protein
MVTRRPARADVHQHLWTPPLLEALADRSRLPFARRSDGIAVLYCAGDQAWVIDVERESPGERADLVRTDGLDLALIALSSPIGVEPLPREEARELIDAHLAGIEALPGEFAACPWRSSAPSPRTSMSCWPAGASDARSRPGR